MKLMEKRREIERVRIKAREIKRKRERGKEKWR